MSVWQTIKAAWGAVSRPFERHVRSDDYLAKLANTGATIVWTHLPAYPLLVWWFAGRPVWPACVLLATVPLFFSVPLIGRHHPMAGRALFVVFGIVNTLLAVKATGVHSDVGWFMLPSFLIAAIFFRMREWKVSLALSLLTLASALAIGHLGPPLHTYSAPQYAQLDSLNLWCVGGLALYLAIVAAWARLRHAELM